MDEELLKKFDRVVEIQKSIVVPFDEITNLFKDGWKLFSDLTANTFSRANVVKETETGSTTAKRKERICNEIFKSKDFQKHVSSASKALKDFVTSLCRVVGAFADIEKYGKTHPGAMSEELTAKVTLYREWYEEILCLLSPYETCYPECETCPECPVERSSGSSKTDPESDSKATTTTRHGRSNRSSKTCSECSSKFSEG